MEYIAKSWFQIIVVLGIIIGWVVQWQKGKKYKRNHIATLEKRISILETDVKWIKEALQRIEKKINNK